MVGVDQHLGGRYPAAVGAGQQPLRDDGLERGGQVGQQCPPVLGGIEAEDTVQRMGGIVGV